MTSLTSLLLANGNRTRVATATALTGLGVGLNFLAPLIFGETIQLLMSEDESTSYGGIEISKTGMIMTLVTIYTLTQITPNLREQLMAPVTRNNTRKVIAQGIEHLLKKSLHYHVITPTSDMINLLQRTFPLGTAGTTLLTKVAPTVLEVTTACTLLSTFYGLELGLGTLGLLALFTGYSIWTTKPIINARNNHLQADYKFWDEVFSSIRRYKSIHDFGQLEPDLNAIRSALSQITQTAMLNTTLPLKIELGHIALSRTFMFLATLFVGLGVQSGQYSVQQFTVLAAYLNQLSTSLPAFGQAINQFFAAYPDLKFSLNELQKPDEIIDLFPEKPLLITPGEAPSIEFQRVSFSYPPKPGEAPKPPLLHQTSFTIQAGKKIALVSESGAGKTTLFNLLYGYYAPSEGTIKINGQDISRLSLKSLQSNIGLFGQTPNLFRGTVRANICYGAQHADKVTDEMIWEVARAANLYDFLHTLKLDTQVGESGKALSGGQQQKVAVLRGLMKKSPIRLLDEITAPFDSHSAAQVLQSMNATADGVTSLMITHKLAEVQFVDEIIVISQGKVIAQGTHEDLLETCDVYKKLWRAMTKDSEDNTQTSSATTLGFFARKQSRDSQEDLDAVMVPS